MDKEFLESLMSVFTRTVIETLVRVSKEDESLHHKPSSRKRGRVAPRNRGPAPSDQSPLLSHVGFSDESEPQEEPESAGQAPPPVTIAELQRLTERLTDTIPEGYYDPQAPREGPAWM